LWQVVTVAGRRCRPRVQPEGGKIVIVIDSQSAPWGHAGSSGPKLHLYGRAAMLVGVVPVEPREVVGWEGAIERDC
jgi:hypothetical protein